MERNLISIHDWMNQNQLKMNPTKTELIYFGNQSKLKKCELESIKVINDVIKKIRLYTLSRSLVR